MRLRPVHVDGWLYFGIGVFGAMTATFGTDAAYKYIEPYHLFWYKSVSTWALAGCTALKTFRSTSYADSLHGQKTGEGNENKKPETQHTVVAG